jgi:carbon monoxide dehydrogenase subunit G
MIETEQTVLIDVGIDGVWGYAHDMRRWAELLPGMREFTVIDDNDSRWVLKVGVGGLVRTVNVLVHVDEWAGPERVNFSYKLEGDPVEGGGSYTATSKGDRQTEVVLKVRVQGGGPMAPMWEAMGRPLLPQLARGFADALKAAIERDVVQPAVPAAPAPQPSGFGAWFKRLWRSLFGSKPQPSPQKAGGNP